MKRKQQEIREQQEAELPIDSEVPWLT